MAGRIENFIEFWKEELQEHINAATWQARAKANCPQN
jgi:hypothetical protein